MGQTDQFFKLAYICIRLKPVIDAFQVVIFVNF